MALTPLSGSSTTPSKRNTLPSDIPNTQSDVLPSMPFISDPVLNKHAIDPTQYPQTSRDLIGFMKGKRAIVTYYRQLKNGGSNNRTNVADKVTSRNILNSEFQKIINLEITLQKGFEFTTNTAQASVEITGQAQFYPNMNPFIGDIFTIPTGDGRIGVCRITSVTPMTWLADHIYAVDFLVQEFAQPSNIDPIEGSVTLVSVFSKANYLGGTAALLSEQTYLYLTQIQSMRRNLIRFFHQMFFDRDVCSYLRPDGIYDPWVVQFITGKLSMDDVHVRPKNLLGKLGDDYLQTVWGRLEDRYNDSMYLLSPNMVVRSYDQDRLSVFISELHNRGIMYPSDDITIGEPYLFSANFYNSKVADMTTEELLIYKAITARDAGDLGVLITLYLDTVLKLPKIEQFYKIPLYIHLIDISLQSQYRESDASSMNYGTLPAVGDT
jgi:hypothetical protein